MVFGTFNVLHPGHIDMFRQARKYGDYLVAVVARDETVKRLKEYSPSPLEERLFAVEHNPLVDKARAGYVDDQYRILHEEKPSVICLGYDQRFFADSVELYVQENNLGIIIKRLKAFKPDIYKSSKMI